MPALPSPGKVLRVDLNQAIGTNIRVKDRIFFSYAGTGPTIADLNTLTTTISAAWNTNLVPQQNTGSTLGGITITDLASASGAQQVTSVARTGTLAGTALMAAAAMIIKFKVARRYRGGHPRIYFCGRVAADLATSTTWTGVATNALVAAWSAFITACIAGPPANIGTMAHVNVSYFLGFTNKTFPSGRTRAVPTVRGVPIVDPITGYSANIQIGSQRRRSQQSA